MRVCVIVTIMQALMILGDFAAVTADIFDTKGLFMMIVLGNLRAVIERFFVSRKCIVKRFAVSGEIYRVALIET